MEQQACRRRFVAAARSCAIKWRRLCLGTVVDAVDTRLATIPRPISGSDRVEGDAAARRGAHRNSYDERAHGTKLPATSHFASADATRTVAGRRCLRGSPISPIPFTPQQTEPHPLGPTGPAGSHDNPRPHEGPLPQTQVSLTQASPDLQQAVPQAGPEKQFPVAVQLVVGGGGCGVAFARRYSVVDVRGA